MRPYLDQHLLLSSKQHYGLTSSNSLKLLNYDRDTSLQICQGKIGFDLIKTRTIGTIFNVDIDPTNESTSNIKRKLFVGILMMLLQNKFNITVQRVLVLYSFLNFLLKINNLLILKSYRDRDKAYHWTCTMSLKSDNMEYKLLKILVIYSLSMVSDSSLVSNYSFSSV